MQKWAGDRLLLHQQPGTNFDLSANAEGVDALIAGGLLSVRTNDFPVIVLRSVIDRLKVGRPQ